MSAAVLEPDPRVGRCADRGLTRPHPPAEVPPRDSRRPGLLLVDHDPLVRVLLGAGLQDEGFAVWVAGDGAEAVQAYGRHAGEVDLVLLDGALPGPGAAGTLRALRRLNPALRCCLLGQPLGPHAEGERLNPGAATVLRKTFRPWKVAPALRRLLGLPEPRPPKKAGGFAFLAEWLWGRADRMPTRPAYRPAAPCRVGVG